MFEPRPFSDKSSAQDNLIVALKNRDLPAFEDALADPDVDPDYWYGKPYWSTCLQLAAKTEGCEAFVLALLRAGAGSPRRQRTSEQHTNKTVDVNGHGAFGDSPHTCVCGAQGGRAVMAGLGPSSSAVDALSMGAAGGANGAAGIGLQGQRSWPRLSGWTSAPATPDHSSEQQTVLFWLRDLGRAVREMSEFMTEEMRGLSNQMERVEERLAMMERTQQHANELLRQQRSR